MVGNMALEVGVGKEHHPNETATHMHTQHKHREKPGWHHDLAVVVPTGMVQLSPVILIHRTTQPNSHPTLGCCAASTPISSHPPLERFHW